MQEGRLKPYYLSYNLQLFAKEGQDGEKTEEPTAKKLEDARKKGQVMRSTADWRSSPESVFLLPLRHVYRHSESVFSDAESVCGFYWKPFYQQFS